MTLEELNIALKLVADDPRGVALGYIGSLFSYPGWSVVVSYNFSRRWYRVLLTRDAGVGEESCFFDKILAAAYLNSAASIGGRLRSMADEAHQQIKDWENL